MLKNTNRLKIKHNDIEKGIKTNRIELKGYVDERSIFLYEKMTNRERLDKAVTYPHYSKLMLD